ncbi:unnamed protein product [Owenia fusiformis]|uniref:Uncharacterized protein n=1 Tax=Owenia fusiformis TaxID=6347 RepID=A0A8J1XK00_OWEFU|nr:unnamed protein product [Owenia fusiformis]
MVEANIPGLVSIGLFYILILAIGIWAGRKTKQRGNDATVENIMLASRNIGPVVGVFSTAATVVGGAFLNGTAEMTYSRGLVWCQATYGFALSLLVVALFFAKKMRSEGYVTMLDPIQKKFGLVMGGFITIPTILADVSWSAGILGALGGTLSVLIGLDSKVSVVVSACIAILYTLFGGLYSVAYTDVLQFFCVLIGLYMAVPFAAHHEAVQEIGTTATDWIGKVEPYEAGAWLDVFLLTMLGGVPWQVLFQRVLSARTAKTAQFFMIVASLCAFVLATPAVLIGAVAYSANWTDTKYFREGRPVPIPADDQKNVLPLVLQYLCPTWVSFIGLGAVSAAVMSSADSSVLSASTMFTRNIYKTVIRRTASEREQIWALRCSILVCGIFATIIGIFVPTVYGLFVVSADLVFVIVLPQLICAVYVGFANTYGSAASYIVGATLRILGGESIINLPVILKYPWYDEEKQLQLFPFRTFASAVTLITLISVSYLTNAIFTRWHVNKKYDIFRCFSKPPTTEEKTKAVGLEFSPLDTKDNMNHVEGNGIAKSGSEHSNAAMTDDDNGVIDANRL